MKKRVNGMSLVAAAAAVCAVAAAPARAADFKAGAWDISVSGNVNAFATYTVCGVGNAAIGGVPLACNKAADEANTFSIESGLLPSALVLTAKTRAYDVDTGATIGLYPGLHVADTRSGAGSNNNFSLDVRQIFFTFGDKSWGTVKLGKDLGLFGSDVILSDMLLLGVGAGTHNSLNHNVTIGHIGSGYIYADWIPQIAYSSPSFGGAQLSLAVVEPFGSNNPSGSVTGFLVDNADLRNDTPAFQARLAYDLAGAARVWVGGMFQHAKLNAPPANPGFDTVAGEAGIKLNNVAGLGAVAYGYLGDGLGTTLIGLDAVHVTGTTLDARRSYGFFGQLTYAIPATRLKPGVSYGMSFVDLASGDPSTFLKSNAVFTAALFYALTDSLTLTAEYDHIRSNDHANGLAKSNSGAVGGILFF